MENVPSAELDVVCWLTNALMVALPMGVLPCASRTVPVMGRVWAIAMDSPTHHSNVTSKALLIVLLFCFYLFITVLINLLLNQVIRPLFAKPVYLFRIKSRKFGGDGYPAVTSAT